MKNSQNIFIVKTQLVTLADLSHKLISNNFSGVKMDFRFRKKSEQLALMHSINILWGTIFQIFWGNRHILVFIAPMFLKLYI